MKNLTPSTGLESSYDLSVQIRKNKIFYRMNENLRANLDKNYKCKPLFEPRDYRFDPVSIPIYDPGHSLSKERIAKQINDRRNQFRFANPDIELSMMFGVTDLNPSQHFGLNVGDLVLYFSPYSRSTNGLNRIYRVSEFYTANVEDFKLKLHENKYNKTLVQQFYNKLQKKNYPNVREIGGGNIRLDPIFSFSSIIPQHVLSALKFKAEPTKPRSVRVRYDQVFESIAKLDLVNLGMFSSEFQLFIQNYLREQTLRV